MECDRSSKTVMENHATNFPRTKICKFFFCLYFSFVKPKTNVLLLVLSTRSIADAFVYMATEWGYNEVKFLYLLDKFVCVCVCLGV